MPEIGKRIRIRREELGITQEELASKLGYKSKTTIAKIENGTNDIVQSKVIEFAQALDTTPAYLMGWTQYNETIPEKNDNIPDDSDLAIIQRERNKMSDKEKTKLMNILKANFDEYNWEDDNSGNIE
ncbi:helix-turn-helix transcriptional regulator [Desulfotomaculum sp. OF05-3]|uniref:helix-turn-helix domain-containing protein n=1 Tax=Desulfotomaculum sp. OF05-3 TaxID=2305243 RepID=UPI000E403925|nr:helix-turn-helix transcriptional regulator [Desulfotomaculum sp. OF05-3]RGE09917.1 XRE family transcriptional regulator [Desulfotomaculum sp. OF05-3]